MLNKTLIAAGIVAFAAPAFAQNYVADSTSDQVADQQVFEEAGVVPQTSVPAEPRVEAPARAIAASPLLASGEAIFDWGSHIDTADDRGIVTPGKIQLAAPLGLDPAEFTTAELVDLSARNLDGV
ncbi:hypothetical protein [Halodurantibacterium flavum]|uniref:Uncharacterized protein n=1 Tax=Halodurantibacterium flavum TaxID=1382802 RepID=A0ABW4S2H1_9RHOB